MTKDVSGKSIWVSSLTHFEYLCVEGLISSSCDSISITKHLERVFTKLDWPCGQVSFGYSEDSSSYSFFCINDKKIAFIFKADPRSLVDDDILSSINKYNKHIKSCVDSVLKALSSIDNNIKISCTDFRIQKTSVTG